MITRGIIGHTIVKVVQARYPTCGGSQMLVDEVHLDNGVVLIPHAVQTEESPAGTLVVRRPPARVNPSLTQTP